MQGLILAAGMGKRLGKYTLNQTKCMVKVNNKTLIEHALEALRNINISRVVIVTGYAGSKLQQFIGNEYKGIEIVYVVNDIYAKTNNIYSLWLAKQFLVEDDTILLESDLIFDKNILVNLTKNPYPNLAVVAKFQSWMDGTVTILDQQDKISTFVPKQDFNWDKTDNYYKTVNIYKFSKIFSEKYYTPFLDAYIKAFGDNEYYENVLKVITYLANTEIKAYKLQDEKWYEIDDIQDLDIAVMLFSHNHEKLALYQNRFGGYWRFEKLKDFCYLVNPYFPNARMINEIKSSFGHLLTQYPSGLNVQNLLAAKMFNCDAAEILVGNGATELIKALMRVVPGSVGIVFPTFNEYAEAAGSDRVKKFVPQDEDFHYTREDLKTFAQNVSALVLLNPDNPSGHFLTKSSVIDLLEYLHSRGIYLILDESFIDFSGDPYKHSLLTSETLQKYQNLLVVKSVSKSYGVPGLRLGVLACGNVELLARIRKELAIWNINSFGEFFLQIVGKYQADYVDACRKIGEERDRFFNELSMLSFLRIIPSKANYFLCKVTTRIAATELARILLTKHEILIKDCTGKIGFENKNYVRFAVRNREDNDYLLSALRTLEHSVL